MTQGNDAHRLNDRNSMIESDCFLTAVNHDAKCCKQTKSHRRTHRKHVFQTDFRRRRNTKHREMADEPRSDWVSASTRWRTRGTDCHILEERNSAFVTALSMTLVPNNKFKATRLLLFLFVSSYAPSVELDHDGIS